MLYYNYIIEWEMITNSYIIVSRFAAGQCPRFRGKIFQIQTYRLSL